MRINALLIERCTHSVKTALACIIAFYAGKLINNNNDPWIIITVLVVMCAQLYVGSVLLKAYMRFIGTLLGCLFSALVLLIWGNATTAIALCMGASSLVFSFVATSKEKFSYAGTLGAVTSAIILIGHGHPDVQYAASRFFEISLGILIATLVSQFVLPIHARKHLKNTQAQTLQELSNFYTTSLLNNRLRAMKYDFDQLDEQIVKLLSKQRQLAIDSAREPLGGQFNASLVIQTLYCEKELLRVIDLMYQSSKNLPAEYTQQEKFIHFHQAVITALGHIIAVLKNTPKTFTFQLPRLPLIADESKNLDKDSGAFIFGLIRTHQLLAKLADLYALQIHSDQL